MNETVFICNGCPYPCIQNHDQVPTARDGDKCAKAAFIKAEDFKIIEKDKIIGVVHPDDKKHGGKLVFRVDPEKEKKAAEVQERLGLKETQLEKELKEAFSGIAEYCKNNPIVPDPIPNCAVCRWVAADYKISIGPAVKQESILTQETPINYDCLAQGGKDACNCWNTPECKALFETENLESSKAFEEWKKENPKATFIPACFEETDNYGMREFHIDQEKAQLMAWNAKSNSQPKLEKGICIKCKKDSVLIDPETRICRFCDKGNSERSGIKKSTALDILQKCYIFGVDPKEYFSPQILKGLSESECKELSAITPYPLQDVKSIFWSGK